MQNIYSKSYIRLILNIFIGSIILLSASLTYQQLALGLTPVTLCIFMAFPFLLIYVIQRKMKISLYYIDLYVILILILSLLSFFWSEAPEVWANNFFWYCICTLVFYLVRFSTIEKKDFKILAFFCFISIIYNFLQVDLDQDSYSNRYQIEGININFTSYSIAAILYIYILFYKFNVVNSRLIFLLFNLFSFILILLLQTRGALISIFLMWFWLMLNNINLRKFRSIYIYSLLFIGFAVTLGAFNFFLLLMDVYFFKERATGDLSGRGEQWTLAYSIIEDNPFLGIGIGSFEFINSSGVAVHNFYLNMMLEFGFVGLLIYVLCFISLFANKINFNVTENLRFTFGLFLSFILPISLSGNWQLAPILWLIFALTFNMLWINKNA